MNPDFLEAALEEIHARHCNRFLTLRTKWGSDTCTIECAECGLKHEVKIGFDPNE